MRDASHCICLYVRVETNFLSQETEASLQWIKSLVTYSVETSCWDYILSVRNFFVSYFKLVDRLSLSFVLKHIKIVPEDFVRNLERISLHCCMQIKGILKCVFALHSSEKNRVRHLVYITLRLCNYVAVFSRMLLAWNILQYGFFHTPL
jgi:hypothetical protein